MAYKQKGWSPFSKKNKEKKRYYRKEERDSHTEETFGSGGREGDDAKKHKQVILQEFIKGDEKLHVKQKYKKGSNIPVKSKKKSETQYKTERGIRKLLTPKNK